MNIEKIEREIDELLEKSSSLEPGSKEHTEILSSVAKLTQTIGEVKKNEEEILVQKDQNKKNFIGNLVEAGLVAATSIAGTVLILKKQDQWFLTGLEFEKGGEIIRSTFNKDIIKNIFTKKRI